MLCVHVGFDECILLTKPFPFSLSLFLSLHVHSPLSLASCFSYPLLHPLFFPLSLPSLPSLLTLVLPPSLPPSLQCQQGMTRAVATEEALGIEYDEETACDVCRDVSVGDP